MAADTPEPSKWPPPDSPELQEFYRKAYAKIRSELTQEDLEECLKIDESGIPFEDVIAEMERIHAEYQRKKRNAS
ncbi:MAG: hypothetical protein ACJ8C4_10085 [Gemmataceae bacterium]